MINFLALVTAVFMTAQSPYPLDQELKSSFGGSGCNVEVTCKVVKTCDIYTYMYSIKNKGNKQIKVKWDVASRAMYFGNTIDLMINLKPDENVIFTLEHPEPPVEVIGKVTAFYLTTNEEVENLIKQTPDLPKKMKIKISKTQIYNSSSGSGYGALPKSWIIENKHEPE